ncbi:MAG: carbon storage regulator CsrA [Pseudomonadota bacterium]|nr:carbon storage regulator CsrA [Pseudomonadota bacterium]
MLYLTRKIGESIIINNNIEMTVVDVRGKSVKIGFTFPKEATILRKELHQRVTEQNIAAAAGEPDLLDFDFTVDFDAKDDNRGNR